MRWVVLALICVLVAFTYARAAEGVYTSEIYNFRFDVPIGWRTASHGDEERFDAAVDVLPPSDRDSSAIVVAVTNSVPELGPARLLARSDIIAAQMKANASPYIEPDETKPGNPSQLRPLELRVLGEGPVQEGNMRGYQAEYVVAPVGDDGELLKPILLRRTAYFLSAEKAYIISCAAEKEADFRRNGAAFDTVIRSFEATDGQEPPPFKLVEGSTYRNAELKFELRAPDGWIVYRPKITEPDAEEAEDGKDFTVLDRVYCAALEGGTTVSLNVLRLKHRASAREAVEEDNRLDEDEGELYPEVNEGECEINGLNGWQSVTRVTLLGAERYRWRVYLESGDLLFPFVCDAVPPEAFEKKGEEIVNIVKSLKLGK